MEDERARRQIGGGQQRKQEKLKDRRCGRDVEETRDRRGGGKKVRSRKGKVEKKEETGRGGAGGDVEWLAVRPRGSWQARLHATHRKQRVIVCLTRHRHRKRCSGTGKKYNTGLSQSYRPPGSPPR